MHTQCYPSLTVLITELQCSGYNKWVYSCNREQAEISLLEFAAFLYKLDQTQSILTNTTQITVHWIQKSNLYSGGLKKYVNTQANDINKSKYSYELASTECNKWNKSVGVKYSYFEL